MRKLQVSGGIPLHGSIRVSGSKNAALPILAACVLTEQTVELSNVPDLEDVRSMLVILRALGKRVSFEEGVVQVFSENALHDRVPYEAVRKMRASFNVLGPLSAVRNVAHVPLPGGCTIGPRPVDMHLDGLQKLGFATHVEHGVVRCQREHKVSEAEISLRFPSVGATEQLLATAAALPGTQMVLRNAATEPEIVALCDFLQGMGARVSGTGSSTLVVQGVERLHGTHFAVIPDRMEAGTYLVAAIATGGEMRLSPFPFAHSCSLLDTLAQMGCDLGKEGSDLLVRPTKELRAADICARVYPGFPTDLQPQVTVLASLAKGVSVISDQVFPGRFSHVGELQRMGAKIRVQHDTLVVEGVEKLEGAPVYASDIRCAAALLVAGLCARGETCIQQVDPIFRGYEKLDQKLAALGAQVHLSTEE